MIGHRLGACVQPDTATDFCVWAPAADWVELVVGAEGIAMTRDEQGFFRARTAAEPGTRYGFSVDGREPQPDPCSLAQPDGVSGLSAVVDPGAFPWCDQHWRGVALEHLVLYELHVGTFSREGTLAAAIRHLPELVDLGVTAVELMPVATFPGERGWGYDGLYTWAVHPAYGGPEALAGFVDAAHASGLAVVLDVVYNHVGPGSEVLGQLGPYFTDRHETFWGPALDYTQRGVREWTIQNAESWVRDFHVDGLRLDATHAIFDESPTHVMTELAERVRALNAHALVISEMETGDLRPIEAWNHDAQWADELHHAAHVMLTGEREGYYEAYGRAEQLAEQFTRPHADRLVVCAQNHDQVGNRAFGDRLHGERLRLAAFCALLAPGIPLVFMGEEYDEAHPFQFFTDHIDPAIADATREGRRREFARFAAFAEADIPDPQAPETFERSKLERAGGDEDHRRYYRELLELRSRMRGQPITAVEVDEPERMLRIRRGPYELVMNFADHEVLGVPALTGMVRDADRLAG